jgi:hypothetical protein
MADPESKRDNSVSIQIIVAIIGLLGVIAAAVIGNWNKIFPAASPGSATGTVTVAHPTKPGSDPVRAVYSKGRLIVRGTWAYDLDSGIQSTGAGADFRWDLETVTKRYLVPLNGAGFMVVGIRDFESVTGRDLEKFHYSSQKIDGSNLAYNQMPQGTVIAYKTNEGRFGKFIVDDYGDNLTISWITYQRV